MRTALGSLIIQKKEGFSDAQLMTHLSENPYMQMFIGCESFKEEEPFDFSLLVHFRKRLGKNVMNEVNEIITRPDILKDQDDDDNDIDSGNNGSSDEEDTSDPEINESKGNNKENKGKLILDASCIPVDIHYPTDIWLLNKARESLEEIIDILHMPHVGIRKKPRTYRKNAGKDYLKIEKKRRPKAKEIRKSIGKQLNYVRRDLKIVDELSKDTSLGLLSKKQYRNLLVCAEFYRQQRFMHQNRTHKI